MVIFAGQAFSLFGSRLVQFALVWWITETTGLASTLAFASIVAMLPQVLLGPFAGALVDRVTLRQIRYPSTNHMHHEPFYEIEPVVLTNPLFSTDYDPAEGLRQDGPGIVTLIPYTSGGKPMVEPVFLQNARTNEIGSFWYEQLPSRESSGIPVTLTLKEPR